MTKIAIRPWEPNDADWLSQNFNNEHIWNNLRDYIPHPYSIEIAENFISKQQELNPTQNFLITNDSERVGGIGITFQEDIYRMNVELGYWISEPNWGNGFASEAVRTMVDYVFESFAINRIVAEVFEYNRSSMRVLEKNGFVLENVARKGIIKNNILLDNYIWVKQKIY